MLEWLSNIGDAELRAKQRALRRVRDAFVYRDDGSLARPTAAEFLLQEMCSLVKRSAGARRGTAADPPPPPLTSLARCSFCA